MYDVTVFRAWCSANRASLLRIPCGFVRPASVQMHGTPVSLSVHKMLRRAVGIVRPVPTRNRPAPSCYRHPSGTIFTPSWLAFPSMISRKLSERTPVRPCI